MNMKLSPEEYHKLNKKQFVKDFENYVKDYFESLYGDAIIVKRIDIGNYFDEIEEELTKYPTLHKESLPMSVLSSSTAYTKIKWTVVNKIDNELFKSTDLNWQKAFYKDSHLFFDFYRMPFTVLSFNFEHDFK